MEPSPILTSPGPPSSSAESRRVYPVGAECVREGGVHFRVWAPASSEAAVELFSEQDEVVRTVSLTAEPGGYFSSWVSEAGPGQLYKFRVAAGSHPDPASRSQPRGPHGPSQVVSADGFPWTDRDWRGRPPAEAVIYELHLGTFTREGTWRAAQAELPELKQLGVTVLEIMPIADFPGGFGWGYDGVNLFAPSRLYGTPDDARAFIDRAHQLGLMVILDVVYNHFGPDGNYLRPFTDAYFSTRHLCEWGEAINFDGPGSAGVREFFVTNARYWIEEFHFDGLRFDATQQIFDQSPRHILTEIVEAVRAGAGPRQIYLTAENESQEGRLVRPPEKGGLGLDAVWNDDWHHAARVAATGKAEGYYSGYRGTAQEFVSAFKHGFLFQGQWFPWQQKRRGRPSFDVESRRFVIFLENHDQVANSLHGLRLHQLTSPGQLRALTAATLLAPGTPLLFQGQEFAASAPFLYFADHQPELADLVRTGRHTFLRQFRSIAAEEGSTPLPAPDARATFEQCRLDFSEREKNHALYRLHRDLLRLRREDPTVAAPRAVDGAVLGPAAFVARYFGADDDDRLLLVNLDADLALSPAPVPLLAPVEGRGWRLLWSSESPAYRGDGTPPIETRAGWLIPARSAVLLAPADDAEVPHVRTREKD